MKLFIPKLFFGLKFPDFKNWWVKVTSAFNPPNIWAKISTLSTLNRFALILGGLILLSGLELAWGYSLLFRMNSELIKSKYQFEQDLRIVSGLKTDLAKLPLVYNEELSGISSISSKSTMSDIHKWFSQLPEARKGTKELKLFKTSLDIISDYVAEPIVFQNYYQIWAEVKKTKIYLDKFEESVRLQMRQATEAAIRRTTPYFLLIIILFMIGIGFWLKIVINEVKGHQAAFNHFEEVTQKVKAGQLQSGTLPHRTAEFLTLQSALTEYLRRLAERYQIISSKINEFKPSIGQLSERLTRNDTQHLAIKQNLREFTDKTYHKLDQLPELSERIKTLNSGFVISQQEATELQESILGLRDILSSKPRAILGIKTRVEDRGKYYQEVTGHLKELKVLLDELQQTIAIFYGISEQTTLLSLNASIEAARAGEEEGDDFSITATEIEELAAKINRSSKNLLNLSIVIGKKTMSAIRLFETSFSKNKLENKYLNEIVDRLNGFINELNHNLTVVKDFSHLVHEFETKEQSLEKLTSILAELKQQSPEKHGKAIAALDVIVESDKLISSVDELDENLNNLKQALALIQSEPHLEEL